MTAFRTAIEARDIDGVIALLADDVVFRSPAMFREYSGPEAVAPVVHAVAAVLADFRYVSEFRTDDGRREALLFEARVGDRAIEGCDFVTWDESGAITELVVMIRPLSGLNALVDAMRQLLEGRA